MRNVAFDMCQPAFGETWAPGPRRWRRCLNTTAPIEMAARAAIAIRIGTRGEEEEPSFWVVALSGLPSAPDCWLVVPLPGLRWPVPSRPPVLGLPFADPAPPDPDPEPDPEGPMPPESPGEPLFEELSAGGLLLDLWLGGVVFPLGPGISVSYAGTPDDSA
jgi:hypothetical protein